MNDDVKLINTKAQPSLSIREKVKYEDIPTAMGRMYGELVVHMQKNKVQMIGPPFAYYHSWSNGEVDVECGFPVTASSKEDGRIRTFTLPEVRAVTSMHIGPYQTIMETYTKAENWIRSHGYEPADHMWETYLNSPQEVPPEKLMTEIFWPIK